MGNEEVTVFARQGNRYLLRKGDAGCIVDMDDNFRYPWMNLNSIVRMGYWMPASKNENLPTVSDLLKVPSDDEDSFNA